VVIQWAIGVVGVSAGVFVYSLQVLRDNNTGFTSWLIAALNWVLANGATANIKVINLSLGVNSNPGPEGNDRDFQDMKNTICGLTQALSDSGIVVTVAAGNEGADLSQRLPAGCPSVMTVTALESDGVTPAQFSNWLPATTSTAEKGHVVAAPGQLIFSTTSRSRIVSGYATMSGTSFAAPHAAAVAANCIIAQQCTADMTGVEKFAKIQQAALERVQLAISNMAWDWKAIDMTDVPLDRYYGLKIWSKF
jgi:subtilisin family serine protease